MHVLLVIFLGDGIEAEASDLTTANLRLEAVELVLRVQMNGVLEDVAVIMTHQLFTRLQLSNELRVRIASEFATNLRKFLGGVQVCAHYDSPCLKSVKAGIISNNASIITHQSPNVKL